MYYIFKINEPLYVNKTYLTLNWKLEDFPSPDIPSARIVEKAIMCILIKLYLNATREPSCCPGMCLLV